MGRAAYGLEAPSSRGDAGRSRPEGRDPRCGADGVAGVSARKIARRVGCSATAIYLHYRNLGDVLHHLRMEGHRLLAEYFRAVDPALSPLQRLREMGRA